MTRELPKLDRKKPEKNAWGVLKEGFAKISASEKPEQLSALAQKFNQPLSKNVDLKKPEINSALSQKFDQMKAEIDSNLSQKVDQKKPEKNSSYETELYYPNKKVSVPSLTLNLTSTMNVTEQLKGIFLKLFLIFNR